MARVRKQTTYKDPETGKEVTVNEERIENGGPTYVRTNPGPRILEQIIWDITGIVVILLGLRFLFLLFGATHSAFVSFIYSLTAPLVRPMASLAPSPIYGVGQISWSTLIAILAYVVIAWIITAIIEAVSPPREIPCVGPDCPLP